MTLAGMCGACLATCATAPQTPALAPPAASLRRRVAFVAPPHAQRRRVMLLTGSPRVRASAAESSDEAPLPQQPLAGINPPLEVENQNERALAYAAITALLGAAGLALVVVPGRAIQFLWGACPMLEVEGLGRNFGSMLLLAAVVASCLKEAAEHDRLRSDTYQRLNLGLMWWGLGTALGLWLAPQQPLRMALGVCTAVLAGTSGHAALTYHETSERGLDLPYLFRQFFKSFGNLGNYKNDANTFLYALYGYGLAAKLTLAAATAILLHGQLRLAQDGLLLVPMGPLGHSLLPAIGVGYALLSLVLFTLKDAAARGRLGASTFRALNIGAAIIGLTNTLGMAGWVQAGILAKGKATATKIALNALLAGMALYNYGFAKKK